MIHAPDANSKHRVSNRCPKCKGGTFEVITTIQLDTARSFKDGVQTFGPCEVSLHSDKASFGECQCGHKWRFRSPFLDYIDSEPAAQAKAQEGASNA